MRKAFPYGNLLIEGLTKRMLRGEFMKPQNVTPYPAGFALIVGFVYAQGFYRHRSPIVYSFPNIAEPAGSAGIIAHHSDSFSGYGVRNGSEVSAVT